MNDLLDDPDQAPQAVAEPLRRAIGERYLTYALSTIMHRRCRMRGTGSNPFTAGSYMQCASCD